MLILPTQDTFRTHSMINPENNQRIVFQIVEPIKATSNDIASYLDK